MLRYQLYQAAAQTISVAGTLFSTLLAALQR
jgi:flagellar hook-associated protein FlgK